MISIMKEVFQKFQDRFVYVYNDGNVIHSEKYSELSQYSNLLKSKFLDNLPKNICVGIYMGKNPYLLVIIYSLIELNISFVILDPDSKDLHNKSVVNDLDLYAILTLNTLNMKLILPKDCKKASLELNNEFILDMYYCYEEEKYLSEHFSVFGYQDICYVMQTSGTLGQKKYVKVTNYCIESNITYLRQKLNVSHNDVIYFGTSLTFDPSIVEILLTLTSGACLLDTSRFVRNKPDMLLKVLFPHDGTVYYGATILQMCPSIFLQWSLEEIKFIFQNSPLRIVALGGEVFPIKLLDIKRSSKLRLYNLYGITEVSCWASICEIKEDEEVALGEVMRDTLFQVRDADGKLITKGEGILYIGSENRLCYINNESTSNLKTPLFRSTGDIVYTDNNRYIYRGRSNNVIKRYGNRINLSILENNITASVNLINHCVWIQETQKIVTFLKVNFTENDKEKIIDKIRVKLLNDIEALYFPDGIELIDKFPVTQNGKINLDELKLLALNLNIKKSCADILMTYKNLWGKYFGVSIAKAELRKNKTFFEMGGTSIVWIRFIDEFQALMGTTFDRTLINTILDSSYEHTCKYLIDYKHIICNTGGNYEGNESQVFKIAWKYDMQACVDTTATVINKQGCNYVAIGNFSQKFVVLNATDGSELSSCWLDNVIENSCCVLPGNDVCVGCFDGYMYCLEISTCNVKWKFNTFDRIKNTGCLSIDQSVIIFGSYDKYLYCVNIQNGELVWKTNLNEAIIASPLCIDDMVVVGCIKGNIHCLQICHGIVMWSFKASNPIFSAPNVALGLGLVIFSDIRGCFYSLQWNTGLLKWKFKPQTHTNMYSSFLVHQNFIIFGTKEQNICILSFNETNCILKSMMNANHEIATKPTLLISNNCSYIIFSAVDGSILLYKLCEDFLELVDSMNLQNKCFSAPVISDRKLFLGCRDNFLYCIDVNI